MKNKLFKRIVSTALCATMAAGLLAGGGLVTLLARGG